MDLMTRRRAMMDSLSRGAVPALLSSNLLSGCTFTSGFLNSSGGISDAGPTTKEVTTNEYIDVTSLNGERICVRLAYEKDNSGWFGVGYYDANRNFLSRSSISSSLDKVTPPTGTAYIRISFRTYGICAAYVAKESVFWINLQQLLGSAGAATVTT